MTLKRLITAAAALAIVPAALIMAPRVGAQSSNQHRLAVLAGVATMQGTWTLALRTAPDGRPHAQPLEGTTIIKLNAGDGTTDGPATGTMYAVERGVLDAVVCACGCCGCGCGCARTSSSATNNNNQLFEIEASSNVELDVTPESTDTNATVTFTHRNGVIKGTYGVFRNGVRQAVLQNTFKMSTVKETTGANGKATEAVNVRPGAKRIDLLVDPKLNVARAGASGSLTDKSHQFKSLSVTGDRMDITWGNGAKDIWIRTAN
jgi:hypothetical protein